MTTIEVTAIQVTRPFAATVERLKGAWQSCGVATDGRRHLGVWVYGTLNNPNKYSAHLAKEEDWVVVFPQIGAAVLSDADWQKMIGGE